MDPGNVNVIMARRDSTTLDDRFETSTNELACRLAAVNSTGHAIVPAQIRGKHPPPRRPACNAVRRSMVTL